MDKKIVLTVARQFGSGGHDVAKKVSELLDIPFYDREIIGLAAKKSGLSENLFAGLDEKPTTSLLYSLVMGVQSGTGAYWRYGDMTGADNVFRIQSQIIRSIAEKDSCVIVGRCADYILREEERLINVFVRADIDYRTQRIMEKYDMKEKVALDYINKTDKRRGSFYNFYTNKIWGNVDNYDLSIATDKIGVDKAAQMIVEYIKCVICN